MKRDELLREIAGRASRGRKVLLVGPPGIGKSWMLQKLSQQIPNAIYVPALRPAKEGLLLLAHGLHGAGRLLEFEYYAEWDDVRKKLAGRPMPRLADLLRISLESGTPPTLLIDHLEGCTPTLLPYLDTLITLAPCVGATNDLEDDQMRALLPKFQRLEVPPLEPDEAHTLLWTLLKRDQTPHADMVETKILKVANGNPGVIADLAANLSGGKPTLREVRELHSDEGTPRVDVTLVLVILLASVTMLRYIGRGMDDLSLTIIGGLGMSLLIVFRPLLWGLARRSR